MTDAFQKRTILALFIVLTSLLVRKLLQTRQKGKTLPQEPPCKPAKIPLIGHAIGLFWHRTGDKWNLPIFSISIFGGKVHIISSPELMHPLHRQPKAASFWFFEAHFTSTLGGMSKRSSRNLAANLEPESSETGLLVEGLKKIQFALSPQGGMLAMNRRAAEVTKSRLDGICATSRDREVSRKVDLWAWTQHEVTVATTECIYGPQNPYRDREVENGFWDFADGTIMVLLAGFLPRNGMFASKPLAGRQKVVKAMDRYFSSGAYKDGSSLVKARYSVLKGRIDDIDLAKFECVNGIAILANTVPTAFWAIFHIFSDHVVLEEVRKQVEKIIETNSTTGDGVLRKIDLRRIKEAPLLFSTIQEAMRLRATGTGPRMVMQDIHLGPENYLLKKDSVIMIANKALHLDKEAWGEDANTFRADRFSEKTPTNAFRGFGGGVNLCPGKNFALLEIATLVAMLVMRFDLLPEGGAWSEPGQNLENMSLQTAPPERKVVVDIVPREGLEGTEWDFVL
ncbi:hypothetical protein HYFRA_00003669 [Hymenoscyphus fraxineus]|uniref:Cytochrome P450 n=1 Tax=Hymenoscyphus fraxineus TaxID=746836 RepID=A0A9N9KZF0_9HELO|nr:hypothetical protein HYFRA_00003669 [Hymenoscyphus fraxineus]